MASEGRKGCECDAAGRVLRALPSSGLHPWSKPTQQSSAWLHRRCRVDAKEDGHHSSYQREHDPVHS
ncbi:hypothetical protein EUGRSUZ_K01094 [Eucalyptus grandis]|uniref:Uncharacterized protein n=2 Tax=Eucalyptus grandis TaxID=71139 RepID=A0ACC3ISE1_EUCGR|nr:hypothetical protein EUGRSUZ_K01094 [Eucalyptus grandis]